MPGNGKPPDWIPPGQRPDPLEEWEADDNEELFLFLDMEEGYPLSGTIRKSTFGFYKVYWVAPTDPYIITPALTPVMSYRATSQDGSAMSVEVQVSSDASFTSPTTITYSSVTSGVDTVASGLGTFPNLSTRYFRIRAGNGTDWSEWVGGRSMKFNSDLGAGWLYAYENIGAGYGTSVFAPVSTGYLYAFENIGIEYLPKPEGWLYAYLNVDTSTPTPHIWALRPTSGREGDGFTLIGFGFGATQPTFSGIVEYDLQDGTGWHTASVVAWQEIAATANMYTPARKIYTPDYIVDPQHQEIDTIVAIGAVPPGLLVRVRTNGP